MREPQPRDAEVESARVLENQAVERVGGDVDRDEIRQLADRFVAERGAGDSDVEAFLAWARGRLQGQDLER